MSATTAALGVCLALAANLPPGADPALEVVPPPARIVFVPARAFTLAWTHSIEKTRWEEDYRVQRGADGAPVLQLATARVRGTGAGMEPPPGSVLRQGWYHYAPRYQPQGALRLTRSAYAADYDWCVDASCRPLGALLPSDGDVTLLWACRR